LLAAAGSAPAPRGIFPYPYQTRTLPNGLRVIVIPIEGSGLVAYYSIVRTGSRDEVEAGKSGFAHFFEHMMFRGTRKYPQEVYNRIVTGIGAQANAYTTDDYTAYHLCFAKEDLQTVVEIESDRFQNLEYSQRAFQTEAGAVYGEYRKSITQPFALLEEKLRDVAFDVHTYKHTTIGFERDIKAMPEAYPYSLTFFQRYYRPENVVLLIVGDVSPQAMFELVVKHYGGWQPGYAAPQIPAEPPQAGERTAEVAYPGKTLPILEIAYKGDALAAAKRDYLAAILLGELAFGPSSDLYRKLVIQQQKVQFIGAGVPFNRDPSLIEIATMVNRVEDIAEVRDKVYKTLDECQSRPVDEARLENLKRRNKYAFVMQLDAPERVAAALARYVALTGGIEIVDQLYTQFDTLTPQDLVRAARKYFVPAQRTVVVLKGTVQ
jgi:zinc protease